MTAAILWVFIVSFPLLLGGPVIAPITNITQDQCQRVRKLMVAQLDAHKSNAAVSPCVLTKLTLEVIKP